MSLTGEQFAKLINLVGDVADPHRAVADRAMSVPIVHKFPRAYRKFIAGVGVSNLQHRAKHGLAFSHQQFQFAYFSLNDRKAGHRAMYIPQAAA